MYRKKSFSSYVLLALEKAVDGYVGFEDFAYNPLLSRDRLKKSELSRVLKRLRENGLVDLIPDRELEFRLTDAGRDKAILLKLEAGEEKWDGKWRVVIFDVPEKRRAARDLLRIKLKSWGFKIWQQSVWVTKKDCARQLRDYIKSVGIKDWVMVFETDRIE